MDTFFPAYLLSILEPFRQCFSKPNYVYFKAYVWSMMINTTRKCMTNTAQSCFFLGKHISSYERFLAENKWDLHAVRKKLVELLLAKLYPYLMIHGALLAAYDTTLVEKAGKKMLGTQRWHSSTGTIAKDGFIFGHHWGIVGLVCKHTIRFICFPILAVLIPGNVKQQQWISGPQGTRKMNFWDASLAAIYELQSYLPAFIKLRVVADAYFSKVPFIQGLRAKCIHLISRLRKNAKGWDKFVPPPPEQKKKPGRPRKKGKEWKLADLIKHFPTETVDVWLYGKIKTIQFVVRDVYLRDYAEMVRVVVIKTATAPMLLLSTDLSLSAKQIIEIYGSRFSIELTIRDLKQHFGFADYQCYSTLAFFRFVSLSCISYGLWMLTLLQNRDAFLLEPSLSFHSESYLSFWRLKRAFKRFVCKQIIFQKFSNHADFKKINSEFEPLLQMV